ncbi:MAG: RsmB/NOP family class I SAM-dependent RNA methyltransferase [Verrucomicrobiota bacterium]|jgi:16S rRNA (cytosine967-C5)-methyltransferase|nr:RsmB/NOP family class I SAM-dependent RNA methyltransferase [Verrucomicrobiota bacterium]
MKFPETNRGSRPETEAELLALAEGVIGTASETRPADAVLREVLAGAGSGVRLDAGWVSGAVFAYYRWLGWLEDTGGGVVGRIRRALELDERFQQNPASFSDGHLVARVAPRWVRDEVEVTPALARAWQGHPVLWLRSRAGQGRAVVRALGGCEPFGHGKLVDVLRYSGSKDLFRTQEFHSGEFEVQDLSSQAVGFACNPLPGDTWWDACAGEGGKTLHLSTLMNNKGLIWSSDRAEWRLKRLKRRAARADVFNYRVAIWDGGAKLPTRTRFDGILVDAPCSGLGTWHRNPHARWTTTMKDVEELRELQFQLLRNAAPGLKPGGRLVYSVCTITRSETLEVAERFSREFPEFQVCPIKHPLATGAPATGGKRVAAGGEAASPSTPAEDRSIMILPQEYQSNGMFIAAWKRAT